MRVLIGAEPYHLEPRLRQRDSLVATAEPLQQRSTSDPLLRVVIYDQPSGCLERNIGIVNYSQEFRVKSAPGGDVVRFCA